MYLTRFGAVNVWCEARQVIPFEFQESANPLSTFVNDVWLHQPGGESVHFTILQRLITRMIPFSWTFVNPGQDTFEVRPANGSTTLHRPSLAQHFGDAQESR